MLRAVFIYSVFHQGQGQERVKGKHKQESNQAERTFTSNVVEIPPMGTTPNELVSLLGISISFWISVIGGW